MTAEMDRVLNRRSALKALSCAAGGMLMSGAIAAPTVGAHGFIDVHQHFFPPALNDASTATLSAILGTIPEDVRLWSPERALASMDKNGIATAVMNASWRPTLLPLNTAQLSAIAREVNEYGAMMTQKHSQRLRHFGFLPMPHVDASLAEAAYCLDVLKTPGVSLMTSYGDKWIGDPTFAPLLAEMDRRSAVIFCHPQPAACCTKLMPTITNQEALLIEFPYDTGRAVVALLMSGSFAKYRNIRWVFCHSGGPVPPLSGRIRTHVEDLGAERVAAIAPDGIDQTLKRLYFETADAAYAPPIAALRQFTPPQQILFGTDYPYVSMESNVREIKSRAFPSKLLADVARNNALALMPSLA